MLRGRNPVHMFSIVSLCAVLTLPSLATALVVCALFSKCGDR